MTKLAGQIKEKQDIMAEFCDDLQQKHKLSLSKKRELESREQELQENE